MTSLQTLQLHSPVPGRNPITLLSRLSQCRKMTCPLKMSPFYISEHNTLVETNRRYECLFLPVFQHKILSLPGSCVTLDRRRLLVYSSKNYT